MSKPRVVLFVEDKMHDLIITGIRDYICLESNYAIKPAEIDVITLKNIGRVFNKLASYDKKAIPVGVIDDDKRKPPKFNDYSSCFERQDTKIFHVENSDKFLIVLSKESEIWLSNTFREIDKNNKTIDVNEIMTISKTGKASNSQDAKLSRLIKDSLKLRSFNINLLKHYISILYKLR
mgnify:CR=1 FL=1